MSINKQYPFLKNYLVHYRIYEDRSRSISSSQNSNLYITVQALGHGNAMDQVRNMFGRDLCYVFSAIPV